MIAKSATTQPRLFSDGAVATDIRTGWQMYALGHHYLLEYPHRVAALFVVKCTDLCETPSLDSATTSRRAGATHVFSEPCELIRPAGLHCVAQSDVCTMKSLMFLALALRS